MNTDELTSIVTVHQSAISRHDIEMAEIRAALRESANRHSQHDQRIAEQEAAKTRHDQWIAEQEAAKTRHDQEMAAIRAQQQLNAQDINNLTASIQDLRNLVADYLQGRTQTE